MIRSDICHPRWAKGTRSHISFIDVLADAVEDPVYVDVSLPTKMERSDEVVGGKEERSHRDASPMDELIDGAARGTNRSTSKDSPKLVEDGARTDGRGSVDVEMHGADEPIGDSEIVMDEPMEGEAINVDKIEKGAAEDIQKLASDGATSVTTPMAGVEYDVSESADGAATVSVDRLDNGATATPKDDAAKETDAYTGDTLTPTAEFLDPTASKVTDISNGDTAYCGTEFDRVPELVNKEGMYVYEESLVGASMKHVLAAFMNSWLFGLGLKYG